MAYLLQEIEVNDGDKVHALLERVGNLTLSAEEREPFDELRKKWLS
ncbi:hypothetical protein OROGR_022363 [Orobanche gracilis]